MLLGLLEFVSRPARGMPGAAPVAREISGLELPLHSERWMSGDAYLEGLARVEHVDDLGAIMLRAGMDQKFEDMGLFGKAVIHAENVWSAISIIRDAVSYMVPGAKFDVQIKRSRCRFSYSHPFGVGEEATLDVQYTVGLMCNVLAERSGLRSANVHAAYPGAQPHHAALLGEVTRVSHGEQAIVEFDDHLLRTPLKRSIPARSELILSAMAKVPDVPDSAREMSELVTLLQATSLRFQRRPLSQNELAEILDTPIRTLQHTLWKEGSRFDQLRDAPRHAIARDALLRGREIDEVANLAGFAHRQNFSRAFSKWEGCAPSEFRSRGR